MGSLFKQIYRYTRPRTFRHNESLWPYTQIERADTGEIARLRYKGREVAIENLSALKDSAEGTVLLTATGPSTQSIDFSKLPCTIPVMGVNGAWFLSGKVTFSLYVIVDMEFFDRRQDVIRSVIADPNILLFTTMHGIAKILDRHAADLRCRLALIEDACYKIYQPKVADALKWEMYKSVPGASFCETRQDICFSTDIRHGIFDAGTVAYWALQILFYLGFNKIVITGLDMSNFNQPRFYETSDSKLPSYLEEKVDNVVMPSFAHAATVMKKNHIEIVNLSPESAIPDTIFHKVAFDEYFDL
ncbi:sugar glycosyltransferase [Kosakonia sp. ML.JS2a]|uniref:sugar glycosyltransferase n=1 Tax=Kosakonia sp. ML.JS2a TaxID=2980557 RepID=UPI0021D9312A|nr:sugar glycosyltransferase [Kosakonia sp. ML.JS2a]UXY11086.1 sugar glycosyltransferase [Kosakonia sp. ML.JS2a]